MNHDPRISIQGSSGLLVQTELAAQLAQSIPETKLLDSTNLLVRWTLENCNRLSLAGFDPPTPFRLFYEWKNIVPFQHQIRSAEFITAHLRCGVWNEQGCVDSDTEYLTPTGWRRIADYQEGEVAQYHPETGAIEFVTPTEYVKLPCPEMIRIRTKYGVDQLLSPEHRVLVEHFASYKQETLSAAALLARHDAYYARTKRKKGSELVPFAYASIPTTFTAPSGVGVPLSDAQVRLQVAVIADGHFPPSSPMCTMRLKRERKVVRIRELLAAAGVEYVERLDTSPTGGGFRVFRFRAPTRDKEFTAAWWGCTTHQLDLVRDEVLHWDGDQESDFFSASKVSADFVQFVFAAGGRTASLATYDRRGGRRVSLEYVLTTSTRRHVGIRSGKPSMWAEPSTDGFKYCFQVPSAYLLLRRNGRIFASGNTGKTITCAAAMDYLLARKKIRRVLVVCPISVMRAAWQSDLGLATPHITLAIAHGTADKRKKVIASDAQVVIINPDGVHIVVAQLAKGGFDLIIIDEATAYQDTSTRRYKALAKIIEPHTRVVLMTGTPASQSPVHAFGLGRLLGTAPKYKQDWEALVMVKQSRFVSTPKIDAAQHVQRILSPSIRFTKEECLDLPERTFCNRDVDMSPEQKKLYDVIKKEMVAEVEGGKITAANSAVLLGKLMQISAGAVYGPDRQPISLNAEPRYEALMDIINGTERKVIIFCNFRSSIQAISERLTKEGIDNDVIHGGVSANDRSSLIFRFQNMPNLRVLVLQTAAAAHGITLTAADTVVWWGPPMSVELYKQANDRPHRIGQKHNVTVYHLLSSYAERKVFTSLRQNISVHEAIVSLFSDVARN